MRPQFKVNQIKEAVNKANVPPKRLSIVEIGKRISGIKGRHVRSW